MSIVLKQRIEELTVKVSQLEEKINELTIARAANKPKRKDKKGSK